MCLSRSFCQTWSRYQDRSVVSFVLRWNHVIARRNYPKNQCRNASKSKVNYKWKQQITEWFNGNEKWIEWEMNRGCEVNTMDGRFGSKVGQIGPKWDKSGAFSDQISVHLAQGAKYTEIWSEEVPFGQIWPTLVIEPKNPAWDCFISPPPPSVSPWSTYINTCLWDVLISLFTLESYATT